ncbi:MAG TPA: formate dehydrogenase accessory sulfurtransferase FdhD [Rhodospirillaceae bacterium]|nr:formate dehydrogenase accessory sulfurtransferase FdhD [Rhodospirillaceae bacterium]
MLASPADLEDFAVGFSLSEGIVANPEEIIALVDDETDDGLLLHMEIPPERMEALETRPRTLPGQSGCGLCGISELEAAARLYPAIETEPAISPDAIFAALDALPAEQKYNQATGAVHAAAFADRAGEILAVREDIGRHNALDKLVGYLRTGDFDPTSGWALLTSRCSIELTQKVMAARIPALVTISAPTGLAVEFAEAHALTLIALARSDGLLVFNDPFGKFA